MANGLYAAIAEGGKPIQLENPLNQMARIATIRGAEQEQQLNAMRLREAEIGARESEALRNYLSGVTDVSSPEARARLMTQFGRTGLGYVKQLSEVEKGSLEAQTKRFDLIKNKTNYYRDALATVNTPEDAQVWTAAVFNDPVVGPTVASLGGNLEQALARIPRDPAQFAQWRRQTALGAQKFIELNAPKTITQDVGGATQVLAIPGLGGSAAVVPGSRAEKTMAPGEAQRLDIDRGRLGLERERVGLERQRLNLAGTEGLSPKEVQKREAAFPQATQSVKAIEAKSDSFINDLRALRDHPGLSEITGFVAGRISGLTADGRAAQALYDKITAKGGFQALQDMRDASKTGGALGNVSNREGQQLVASFAAIDRRQDAPDVRAAIDQAIGDIEGSKTRIREAYDLTYSYKKPSSEAVSPTPAPTPAPTPGRPLSPIDQQALNWARANPKDPRAQQIKDRLGVPR